MRLNRLLLMPQFSLRSTMTAADLCYFAPALLNGRRSSATVPTVGQVACTDSAWTTLSFACASLIHSMPLAACAAACVTTAATVYVSMTRCLCMFSTQNS